ncbi:MAG: hypothetical protein MZU95_17675 [Desulfomicrobium escambiense]|nr:hypothetical protein [Desulfomicrobium escambiense]
MDQHPVRLDIADSGGVIMPQVDAFFHAGEVLGRHGLEADEYGPASALPHEGQQVIIPADIDGSLA